MTISTLPRLHTLEEVATQYGLSLRGLKDAARAKRFAHIKLGRERRLTDDQLRALLKLNTVTADSGADKRAADLAATAQRVSRRRRSAA